VLLPAITLFVVSLGYGVIVPVLPDLVGVDASGVAALSLVYAIYSAAKIGAQVPGGVWVDRRGPDAVLRVALPAFSVSLALFMLPSLTGARVGGAAYFGVARFVEGAATGLVYPAVVAVALRSAPPERMGRDLGTVIGVGSSGLLVGPVLGAALRGRGAWVPIAVALGASLLVTVAVLAPRRGRTSGSTEGAPRTLKSELASLWKLAASAAFLAIMLPVAFNKLTFSAFQGLIPLVAADVLHVGDRGVAALFVTIGVVFGVAQPLAGALADRYSPRAVVLATLPLQLGALAALSFVAGPWAFGGVFGAHILGQSIVFTATTKHAARAHATEKTYGGVFGLMGTLTDLATIVGPILFLNVYAASGARVFVVMATVGVACALVYAARGRSSRLTA
jgi:MFS family permease